MITGILKKFEPTEEGITIIVKVSHDQIQEVCDVYKSKQEIMMQAVQPDLQPEKAAVLADIRNSLEIIKRKVEKEL